MMAAVDSLLVGRKKAIKHSLYYSKKMHYHFLTPFFYYCSEIAWIRIQIFGFNEYGTETLPEITLNMCICRFIISEILLTVKKFLSSLAGASSAGLWIRIHFLRIRIWIQQFLNVDPESGGKMIADPDPA